MSGWCSACGALVDAEVCPRGHHVSSTPSELEILDAVQREPRRGTVLAVYGGRFAFVTPDGGGDNIFVPKSALPGAALHPGDRVDVTVAELDGRLYAADLRRARVEGQ
jgi:cold shock CspA family protein